MYVHIKSEKVDKGIEIDQQNALVNIIMSDSDLQYDFERVIQNNLNEFAPVRSISTVKTAIINVFSKHLYLRSQNRGIILPQNIIVNNRDIFGRIISIFDTNAGKWFNENDNEVKSNALQEYITDKNKKGKNLITGYFTIMIEQHIKQWKCSKELFK